MAVAVSIREKKDTSDTSVTYRQPANEGMKFACPKHWQPQRTTDKNNNNLYTILTGRTVGVEVQPNRKIVEQKAGRRRQRACGHRHHHQLPKKQTTNMATS